MDTPSRAWSELLDWSIQSTGESIRTGAQFQGAVMDWWMGALGLTGAAWEQRLIRAASRRDPSMPSAADEYLEHFDFACEEHVVPQRR